MQEQRASWTPGGTRRASPDMNAGSSRSPASGGGAGDGYGVPVAAAAATVAVGEAGPPSVRELKLQLFYRLQARGPRGAWTRYWTGFQRFLAARMALEEFHALATELMADEMHLHNQLVVALLGVAHGGRPFGGAGEAVEGPASGGRPSLVVQQTQRDDETMERRPVSNGTVQVKREPGAEAAGHHHRHHHHYHDSHPHRSSSDHRHKTHHHQHQHQHHRHHSCDSHGEREHDRQGQQQHHHHAGSRKRAFSSITTASAGSDGTAAGKLLHLSSSDHHSHHADDDHQSAKLLIGLGQANALISPQASDNERSRRSASYDGSSSSSSTSEDRGGDAG